MSGRPCTSTVEECFLWWPHKCAVTGKRMKALRIGKRLWRTITVRSGVMYTSHDWISNKGYVILKLRGEI